MKIFKKIICMILALCLALPAAACGGSAALDVPQGIGLSEDYVLSWEEVEGARSYEVEIENTDSGEINVEPSRRTAYSLSALGEGNYSVRIRSVGGSRNDTYSEWSESFIFHRDYESGLVYSLINNNTEYRVTKAGTATGDIVIEDMYRGKPVTEIGDAAFRSSGDRIKSVTLGGNIRSIGSSAFYNCTGLERVTMSDSVVSLGESAFQNCASLVMVRLSANITELPEYAFAYCRSLETFEFREGLVFVGASAFTNCSGLKKIEFPASLSSIAEYAFNENDALTEVVFGEGIRTISKYAFYGCDALASLNFGTLAEGGSLTLGDFAFADCDALVSAELPQGTATIGKGCFSQSEKFEDISIPDSVGTVGAEAFDGTKLMADQAESDLVYADKWVLAVSDAYYGELTRLDGEVLHQGTIGIADYAFIKSLNSSSPYVGCAKLATVDLPVSVRHIGAYAFYNSQSLTELFGNDTGSALEDVGDYAFANCTVLNNVQFANGLREIGQYAFYGCIQLYNNSADPHLLVPSTVTRIGSYAFRDTALWSSVEADSVIYAGNWAVGYSGSPAEITLSETVEGIADYAFYNARALQSCGSLSLARHIGVGAFYGCSSLLVAALNNNIAEIGVNTFSGCASLWRVTFPSRLTSIGRSAFYNCAGLLSIDLSSTRTETIGERAFYGCGALSDARLGSRVQSIGLRAFYGCSSLSDVTIPESVREIGEAAFAKCAGIGTLTLSEGLEAIGDSAFRGAGIEEIHIPDSVRTIGACAFYEVTGCKALSLGDGVTKIGEYAFGSLGAEGSIVIPTSVKEIGNYAFAWCTQLKGVIFRGSVEKMGLHAFYSCSGATFYVKDGAEEPAGSWNSSYRPVVYGCTLSGDGTYVVSVTTGGLKYATALGGLTPPVRDGFDFVGWATEEGGEAVYGMNDLARLADGVTLYAVYRFHVEEEVSGEAEPSQI